MSKWTVTLTNSTTGTVVINDLGFTLTDSETRIISHTFKFDVISTSQDLKALITSGTIEVNDGTDDLTPTEGVDYIFLENKYHVGEEYITVGDGHTLLGGRSEPFQHPISAITNLTEELSAKASIVYVDTELSNHVDDFHALSAIHTADVVALSAEIDTVSLDLSGHMADINDPHDVTKAQVGLPDVENYSAAGMPISDATNIALGLKSNITYTDSENAILSAAIDALTGNDVLEHWTEAYDVSSDSTSWFPENDSSIALGSVTNTISGGTNNVIGGGKYNTIVGEASVIAGGGDYFTDHGNEINGFYSMILGGHWNILTGNYHAAIGSLNICEGSGSSTCIGIYNISSGYGSICMGADLDGAAKNEARGDYSTIAGGRGNKLYSDYSTIAGGHGNELLSGGGGLDYNFIGGGSGNILTGIYDVLVGGQDNTLTSSDGWNVIVGGWQNTISDTSWGGHFIGSGWSNQITSLVTADSTNSIVGGNNNSILSGGSIFIGGGVDNQVNNSQNSSIVGGSTNNITLSDFSFIGSGNGNTVQTSDYQTIAGGHDNTASGIYSFIGGGYTNITSASNTTVAGGYQNSVAGADGTIGGGRWNKINSGTYSVIAGGGGANDGGGNEITNGDYSVIAGGEDNIISGSSYSAIGGGGYHQIIGSSNFANVIVCGDTNKIEDGDWNFIGSGQNISLSGNNLSSVVGGSDNSIVGGNSSFIGGGSFNIITSDFSTIVGGKEAITRTYGQQAYASGKFTTSGDAQASRYIVRNQITSSTKAWLYSDGSANGIWLEDNQTMSFIGTVTARTAGDTPDLASWKIEGVVSKSAADVITVHDYTVTVIYNPTSWTIDVSESATNYWSIGFTGVGWTEDIRVVADIQTSEVIFV